MAINYAKVKGTDKAEKNSQITCLKVNLIYKVPFWIKNMDMGMKNSHKVTKTAYKSVSTSFIIRKDEFKAMLSHFLFGKHPEV